MLHFFLAILCFRVMPKPASLTLKLIANRTMKSLLTSSYATQAMLTGQARLKSDLALNSGPNLREKRKHGLRFEKRSNGTPTKDSNAAQRNRNRQRFFNSLENDELVCSSKARDDAKSFAMEIASEEEAMIVLKELAVRIQKADDSYYDGIGKNEESGSEGARANVVHAATANISDAEYDYMRMKYDAVENRFENLRGLFDANERVGSGYRTSARTTATTANDETSFEYKKYKHLEPMLSLKNAFNEDEVREFDERVKKALHAMVNKNIEERAIERRIEYCAELKIDGVSASLLYENGKLSRVLSRGDGEFGEDITRHILSSCSSNDVPKEISIDIDSFEIRGEVYVDEDDFERVNAKKISNGEQPFKNARNAAAGVMRMKEANKDVPLRFIPHGWGGVKKKKKKKKNNEEEEEDYFRTQIDFYKACAKWGFSDLCLTRSKRTNDLNDLFEFHKKAIAERDSIPHKIDGVVYKINETNAREIVGSDARAPKWAIAHKFVADYAVTKLEAIEVQVGRTGVLTPVAILEPCELNGATIRRATLHNFFEIERKKIQVGQEVVLERAGDVIPKIIRVANDSERRKSSLSNSNNTIILNFGGASSYAAPMLCPCCNSVVSRDCEDGMVIRCNAGLKCPAQRTARATHFASKKALDIRGLAEKQIEKLFEFKAIEKTSDIFTLEERFYSTAKNKGDEEPPVWARYENATAKKKNEFTKNSLNMFAAIREVKENGVTLAKFIYALGIPFVGEATAKEIAKTYGTLEKFQQAAIKYYKTNNNNNNNNNSNHNREDDDDDDDNNNNNDNKNDDDVYNDLETVEGVGEIVAKSIANFWNEVNNANEVNAMLLNGLKIIEQEETSETTTEETLTGAKALRGLKICVTGTFDSLTREEIQSIVEQNGGSLTNALTKSTNVLLVGDAPGQSKLEKAERYAAFNERIKIIRGFANFVREFDVRVGN